MKDELSLKAIAKIRSDFSEKFGIPRQSGIAEKLTAKIVFEKEYRSEAALRGLEDFSHIWLIWGFSENIRDKWSPTVRPPRLGGNAKLGVFATRSPFRPNPVGLSCVKIERIELQSSEGPVIYVSGADLMDMTPIYDIKPYISYTDSHPDAMSGFVGQKEKRTVKVNFPKELLELLPEEKREGLVQVLEQDPRPAYQNDERTYGFEFAGFNIRFKVKDEILSVIEVCRL